MTHCYHNDGDDKHIIRTSANESLMKISAIEEVSFEAVEYKVCMSKQALSFAIFAIGETDRNLARKTIIPSPIWR